MIQQKIETAISSRIAVVMATLVALLMIVPGLAYADTPSPCTVGTESSCSVNSSSNCSLKDANGNIVGTVTNCTDPAATNGDCVKDVKKDSPTYGTTQCGFVAQYVQPFVNFLSALVGVAVTISIVVGGIQYGSSAGDSAKVTAAKNRIRNSVIALLAFIFLYAMLNFLIPGGLV